ncbi:Phage integrase family protein [Sphingomonas sp. YR710]|uniref:tyrosine-type recombinase/integrase n=1 Tax=Sphingomonas sp. YR710 TaxID=1882773 RepID=UPI00087E83C1|nr:site-specific integrase [Sphingomonas sp. YR710]SDC29555.1 Phage integrase family protein [Sphingomonas sp. YR710]
MSDIEGVHFVRIAKPGKPIRWYVYAWRGGPCVMKAEGPNKPKLGKAEVTSIGEKMKAATAPDERILRAMIRGWRGNGVDLATASPEWRALAPSTRALWGGSLDLIDAKWGRSTLAAWDDPRMVAIVVAWRDSRASTPRAADVGITVLAELLEWARLRAKVRINVAKDIPQLYHGSDRAEIIWTDDDMKKAKAAADELKRPRIYDIIRLATLTGMRRGDLAAVTLDEVFDHAIIRTAAKKSRGRRRRAVIPMFPALAELIDELRALPRKEGVRNLLVGARGAPWKPESLTEAVNAITKKGGIEQPGNAELGIAPKRKHLHDCRGTFVTHLCRAGLSNEEIARAAAWSVESVERIRQVYVDDAAVVISMARRIARQKV